MRDRYDWIIGICCSADDGVRLYRFRGTIAETKKKLLLLINSDRDSDRELWEYGCESVDDIEDLYNGLGYELYGHGVYQNHHIDYTAKELAHVEDI